MLIYRVEHTNGWGPYGTQACNISFIEILEKAGLNSMVADYEHPSPLDDDVIRPIIYKGKISNFHFGFETFDQLIDWWYTYPDKIINTLRNLDFHISVYEVEEHTEYAYLEEDNLKSYYLGNIQAIFNKKYAKLVQTMDL